MEEVIKFENVWIDVNDRLPENFQSCLTYRKGLAVSNMYFNNDLWYADGYDCKESRTFDDITHWMPLPKPPQK